MPSFKSMRSLDITPRLTADASVLAGIGQFEHLRALSIHIGHDCTHLQGCLQALAQLSIGGRAVHIQSFLAATSPPFLQNLGLFFIHDSSPSTELIAQCVSAVSTTVPPTLSAPFLESRLTFNHIIASAMDVIQPALALRTPTRFTFRFKPLPSISAQRSRHLHHALRVARTDRPPHRELPPRIPPPPRGAAPGLPSHRAHSPHDRHTPPAPAYPPAARGRPRPLFFHEGTRASVSSITFFSPSASTAPPTTHGSPINRLSRRTYSPRTTGESSSIPTGQPQVIELAVDDPNVSGYAAFEGGRLARAVFINLHTWLTTSSPGEPPLVHIDFEGLKGTASARRLRIPRQVDDTSGLLFAGQSFDSRDAGLSTPYGTAEVGTSGAESGLGLEGD